MAGVAAPRRLEVSIVPADSHRVLPSVAESVAIWLSWVMTTTRSPSTAGAPRSGALRLVRQTSLPEAASSATTLPHPVVAKTRPLPQLTPPPNAVASESTRLARSDRQTTDPLRASNHRTSPRVEIGETRPRTA